MKREYFEVQVPAKWVLSGEHAVLRGVQAVAFPQFQFFLSLKYRNDLFEIAPSSTQSFYRDLFFRSLKWLGSPGHFDLGGNIEVHSTIPQGAGFGSSAALCVAMARFAIWFTHSDESLCIGLATRLEDEFHGKSSGMDVSAIAQGGPILFKMGSGAHSIDGMQRMPNFKFEDSGLRGKTRDCIERVNLWQEKFPDLKDRFDLQMQSATDLAVAGLQSYQKESREGLRLLQASMEQSQNCLETWGLITPELAQQKQALLDRGALAVKLTGAGLGGFWVSLWNDVPDLDNFKSGNIIKVKQ